MSLQAAKASAYGLLNSANAEARYNANSAIYGGATSQNASERAGNAALSSLSHNYKAFLTLLITQLKHQDPSSPMSNDSFTRELVEFASVEQQVESNTKLSSLISLNESGQMSADDAMVGERASAQSHALPLQHGKGDFSFTGEQGRPAVVAIAGPSGQIVRDMAIPSTKVGQNSIQWDGKDNAGRQLPDGAYSVAVKLMDLNGNPVDAPTTVYGTVTGVQKGKDDMMIKLGSSTVPMNDLVSVSKKGTPARQLKAASNPYKKHKQT